MMKLNIYQVDAFADKIFSGNPAAVCPLESWPDDSLLLHIARENNLSETAFYVKQKTGYDIRWFTPQVEVQLCGHATLAAAYVLFYCEHVEQEVINFNSRYSGLLPVRKKAGLLWMNFPADVVRKVPITRQLGNCFNVKPAEVYKGLHDYLFIYDHQNQVQNLKPDMEKIVKIICRGIIVSAPGDEVDFVSRFFAPRIGVPEDPVTGSAHTTLVPFWASRLGKDELRASQVSARGGSLFCSNLPNRVEIGGAAQLYMKGEIFVE